MNAALITAAATNALMAENSNYICLSYPEQKPKRRILGKVDVALNECTDISFTSDPNIVELRFGSSYDVDELILKLGQLRDKMVIMEHDSL